MVKFLKRAGIVLLALILLAWILWPDTWVARGPILQSLTGKQVEVPTAETLNSRLQLPDGYTINIFAQDLPNARMMAMTESGDIIVSLLRKGEVALVLADRDGDGHSDSTKTLLSGLNMPHGLTLKDGFLYVAENQQISRFLYDEKERRIRGEGQVIFSGLPEGGNHRSRTIDFGPDGKLYVTVGSSCNVCLETEPYRAEMLVMNADGTDARTYATGLRNAVGFDWHPLSGDLFAADNGRDLLGDEIPNCELNNIVDGGFYGWPLAYDDNVIDGEMGRGHEKKIATAIPPVHGFGAHRAPLGMHFVKGEGYLQNNALVALHGSWNSSTLVGYKVVALLFDEDGSIMQQDFITGFEKDGDVIGRPVDVEEGPDGSLYITDDYTGVIYRITVGDQKAASSNSSSSVMRADPLAGIGSNEVDMYATLGQEYYGSLNCVECHEDSSNTVTIKALTKLAERYTLEDIIELLDVPPGPMPRPEIDDEGRKALAVYLMIEKG